jgi:hypothetical protein
MRVWSWRCLSTLAFVSASSLEFEFWDKCRSPKAGWIVVSVSFGLLAACTGTSPTQTVYKTPGIDSAHWRRIDDTCKYEAAKATASADPRTAPAGTRARLVRMCLELKGAQYVGRVTMPDDRLDSISARCNDEAKAAVAGRPASHDRDQRQEDLAIDCMRREGIAFR